jgi:hypothetical protein
MIFIKENVIVAFKASSSIIRLSSYHFMDFNIRYHSITEELGSTSSEQ